MTRDSRMSKVGARRLLALTATAVMTAMVLASGGAGADTSGSPDTNTRAVINPGVTCPNATPPTSPCASASNGATPTSTLSGAAEGTPVSIHVDGSAGTFFGVNAARMCKSGLNVVVSTAMNPSTGNCVGKPFVGTNFQDSSRQDDGFMQVSAAPSNTSVDFTFRVGSGTASWSDSGGSHSLTCDAANACAVWLWESVDTSISPSGNIFKHYDITYTGSGTTTTTTGATTTTTGGGTTTTTAGGTTTTTAGGTTTTTAGGTTTTTAGGTTTTTGATTTTTAAATTTTTGATTTTTGGTTSTTAGGTTTTTGGGTTTTTAGATTTTVPTGTTTSTTRPSTTTTTAGATTTTTGATTTTSTTTPPPPPSTHVVTGFTRLRTLGPGDWLLHDAIAPRGLHIEPGANVTIMHSTVLHGIKDDGGGAFTLCGSLVTNGVKVTGATGFVLVGNPFDGCARNMILGGMSLQSNTGGVEAIGNQISGPVTVSGNSGTGPPPENVATELAANSITGKLACNNNTPGPVNGGLSNVVSGKETGQCTGL